jgi:hypothetical protein
VEHHQAHVMPKRLELARPMMRRGAGRDPNHSACANCHSADSSNELQFLSSSRWS